MPISDSVPSAFDDLHKELAKTAVLSDSFKDYLIQQIYRTIEELTVDQGSQESEALRQEFMLRRFSDKTAVKLGATCMQEVI